MTTDTIVRVDPKTLLVGPNVRKEVTLPAEFVASVKEHGVKIPIVAHETPDGLEVVDGQMRTLAALDAGLTEVPVFVRPVTADAERVVDQLIVNRERTSLSRADTVAAVKQLALDFKLPAAEVAKRVGISRKDVDQVVIIAGSPAAVDSLDSQITLDLAAKIAEAGLTKAEAKRVVEARWNTEHALQQVIDARATASFVKKLTAQLDKDGVTVAAKPSKGDYNAEEKNKHSWLDELVDKVSGKPITPKSHTSCEGHAAWVGVRGYNGKTEIYYLCTDPAKFGHRGANVTVPVPLTDAQKAERVENTAIAKVWPSIVEVRLAWIREQLLTRKTMPAGWERLEAWITLEQAGTGGSWDWGPFAAELLGVTEKGYNVGPVVKWAEAHPTKTTTVLVAVAIAKVELSAAASKSHKGWRTRMISEYLELLASWGYGLSEVEQTLVDGSKKVAAAA